jgi:phospholipase/lecithinase/hemolysin
MQTRYRRGLGVIAASIEDCRELACRRLPHFLYVIWNSICGWRCLIICLALCSAARARTWETLYAFGDSYTDSGAGYVDGNRPTAMVYLAASLSIPFTYAGDRNSTGKGLNFAVSGAQTGKSDGMRMRPATAACGINEGLLGRGMQTQVLDFSRRFQSGDVKFKAEKTLFFLAGGLNDAELPTAVTIANLEGEIRELYAAGARYFEVALLPTKIPSFSAVGARLNPAIAKIPEDLRPALPGAHIVVSHWGEYFDLVIEKPGDYGLKNTTDRCAGRALFGEDSTPCSTPDAYFYFHDGHPSTAVQRVVSQKLLTELANVFP